MALKPSEFWASTPAEIAALGRGWKWRNRYNLELIALQSCWLINGFGMTKRAIKPSDLLPSEPSEDDRKMTTEEVHQMLDEISRGHKKKFWAKLSDKYA